MSHLSKSKANQLELRTANWGDSSSLLEWRNDELTRVNSHSSEPISISQHEAWFKSSLDNPNRQIFIVVDENQSVGMIRVDASPTSGHKILSWAIAPACRGRGLGTRMLSEACKRFRDFDLIAEVKETNAASKAMVSKCGFYMRAREQGVETWIRSRETNHRRQLQMSRTTEHAAKIKKLIPGGSHTYSKGDDQWPEIAPKCIERGKGAYVWDADGNRFIEWSMGLTAICLGHANDEINKAAIDAMSIGHNFQRPSVMEATAAEKFLNFLGDRGEMVKFSKNGSTVTTAAVKLSRAFTGRNKVAVCAEHPFFSYDDWFIGATRCPAGVPDPIREMTVKFSYNNPTSVEKMFADHKGEIACVILEPVKFDRPKDGFLQKVQEICKREGAILIWDEMVTGFKWGPKGAAGYYGVKGDLYTWGKGMANGHSVCALTGRRDIMELGGIDHDKPRVFLSSTTHGAEIPQLAAMIKTLEIFERDPKIFDRNWQNGAELKAALNSLVMDAGLKDHLEFLGEDLFFVVNVKNPGIHKANVSRTFLLQEMVRRGQLFQGLFYLTPAHTPEVIKETLAVWKEVLPVFKKFIESGHRSELVGEATRPVFRRFNSCECLSLEDCQKCQLRV
jgi:glutamate-1-semialdehyde 2,1-aminomutase